MSDGSYFVDHKRGEVLELKQALTDKKVVRDPRAKREVIKKIIAYMTLGIDVSVLFSDMVMATNTRDLVIKKMIYLYLCTYAEKKPDVALLAVNTLLRDCRDDDPMIRGLALRSLCSLRVPNLVEYVVSPIRNGLTDSSAYCRKAAVLGVAKLFTVSPSVVRDSATADGDGDLVDILYNALRDKDIDVCVNAIHALNEILIDEGGIAVNRKLVQHLLQRMHEASEWGQIAILDVVSKYLPSNREEVFDIMNGLNDRLKHSNSALVLATIKVFLNITRGKALSVVHRDVYKKVKAPLMTLIASPDHSVAFPVLAHTGLLVKSKPGLFADCYKHFYLRHNEITCMKQLKIDILANVANHSNYVDILNELSEYVTSDMNTDISRLSVSAMAKACIRVGDVSIVHTLKLLKGFLDMSWQDYIISESCVCVKNILRKYPKFAGDILPELKKHMKAVDEENGKSAVLWLLGEYGGSHSDSGTYLFKEAPYILEDFIDNFNEESSSLVKLEMLTASMKLFFKSPAEMHAMLGRLLDLAILDCSKIHVRDRAVFYYRLLQQSATGKVDMEEIEQVINCPKVIVDVFEDPYEKKITAKLFDEFNTLAVVYGKPSEMFVNEEIPEFADESSEGSEDEDESEEVDEVKEDLTSAAAAASSARSAALDDTKAEPVQRISDVDLLDLSFAAPTAAVPTLNLKTAAVCTPVLFKSCWSSLPVAKRISRAVQSPEAAARIEGIAKANRFRTIASGTVGGVIKCYMFAQETDESLHFVEFVVQLATHQLAATVKGQSPKAAAVADFFENIIASTLR